jgi:hypothetical protein
MFGGAMILAFEFTYVSKNGILETLLQEIATDFGIVFRLTHQGETLTLYVEDTKERLGAFADVLSLSLPLSIFFKSSSVYVADALPTQSDVAVQSTHTPLFTPKVLALVEQTKAPFASHQGAEQNMALVQNDHVAMQAKNRDEYLALYASIADALASNVSVGIQNDTSSYTITTIENAAALASMEAIEVIATDLSVVERLAVVRDNEIKALASMERPSIRVKVNALFAQKNILPTQRVVIRLGDDLFLYQLSKVLFEKGIHFIARTAHPFQEASTKVILSGMQPALPLQIAVFENGEIALIKGDAYASKSLKESTEKFDEPSHGVFASLMQENNLFDASVSCFYLSKTHQDRIMHYSKEHGMLNLIEFPLPASFEELFSQIARSNPNAQRLVENYQTQYREICEKALQMPLLNDLPQSVYSLFKIASIVLGLSDSFENAAERLLENAEDFGGQKGPRMDCYLQKEDALSADFDYVRLIKSAMSYKLAGTDDNTLSFGLVESMAYFLTDLADAHKETLANQKIALGGSLFGYKRFSEIVIKNIKPNHTICMNKELPIDL